MAPANTSVPAPPLLSEPANARPVAKATVLAPVSTNAVAPGTETARRLLRSTVTPPPYTRLPPLKLTAPVEPNAPASPTTSSPPLSVAPPVKVLGPASVREPLPTFVKEPAPESVPENVVESLLAPMVTARGCAPVCSAKLPVLPVSPPKLKLESAPAEKLPAPPVSKVLSERAAASARTRVPEARRVLPVNVLAAASTREPAPESVSEPLPANKPLSVEVPVATPMVASP